MKKFVFLFCAVSLLFSRTVMATSVVGIQVEVKKGTKEWNADRTKTECVGKGFCEMTITGTVGGSVPQAVGTLGWIDGVSFGISFPSAILNDKQWKDTFENGVVSIQSDLVLTPDITAKIKQCPTVIKAGKYRYKLDGNSVYVYFN